MMSDDYVGTPTDATTPEMTLGVINALKMLRDGVRSDEVCERLDIKKATLINHFRRHGIFGWLDSSRLGVDRHRADKLLKRIVYVYDSKTGHPKPRDFI